MKKFSNHLIGVDRGDVVLFSDFDSGGPMWAGEGPRISRTVIKFANAYRSLPSVSCWLSMLDMSNGANARLDVQAEDVTETGFVIVFRTWGDTQVARVRAAWQSIGELRHDDDWDIA